MKLFKNIEYLYESVSDKLTDAEAKSSDYIQKRIKDDIERSRSGIIAFVSPNGSGKSTLLKTTLMDLERQGVISYSPFEVWENQNKNEVWDNFLIAVLAENSRISKDKVVKSIKRHRFTWPYWAIIIISILVATLLSFVNVPSILIGGSTLYVNLGGIAFSGLGIFGLSAMLAEIFSKSKVNYTYQYKDELIKILGKDKDKPIVMLVEDVDRSKSGEKMIESLHIFLNENKDKIKRPFITICPISRDSFYGKSDKDRKDRLEVSNKMYDYAIWGGLRSRITENDISVVLSSAQCTDGRLGEVLSSLLKVIDFKESLLNLRALKFILREVDQFITRYPRLDPCIATLFVITKYVSIKQLPGSLSGHAAALKNFLTDKNGNTVNWTRRSIDFMDLITTAFDIADKISWKDYGNGVSQSMPICFLYQGNDCSHKVEIDEGEQETKMIIKLSGHYKELL